MVSGLTHHSQTELLDAFTENKDPTVMPRTTNINDIGFHNASFIWTHKKEASLPVLSREQFALSIEGDLIFPRGQLSLIVGPTGSGKTALLMALLGELWCAVCSSLVIVDRNTGEMHFVPIGPKSWFNMPRSSGVAYAAQESWVQNETIKVRPHHGLS
jgi:ABC-type uncharacterized transport system fused permease/ATPase subunit